MATGRVQDICATMKRFIESMKKEIKRKEDTIQRQQERLRKLTAQPNPDSEMVKEIRDDIARLERELIERSRTAQRAGRGIFSRLRRFVASRYPADRP